MNRNQRRFGKTTLKHESKVKVSRSRHGGEMEEVLPPKTRRDILQMKRGKSMTNRCCYASPEQKDFGQSTEFSEIRTDYQNLLLEQYGFDPIVPDTISQLKELKKVLCGGSSKVENSSQYVNHDCKMHLNLPAFMETTDGSHWENVDNTDDIDRFLMRDEKAIRVNYDRPPKNIRISEVPRVKIIAEKFSKFKKENIELRRVDEKVVCVEYDIYDEASIDDMLKPVQKMRAFFSVKPVFHEGSDNVSITELPSGIKNKFHISEEDLKKLTEKEIEIIDGKIDENRPYLDDLKRILKRKQIIDAKKNKESLDLFSLYEMARKERFSLDSDYSHANLLSKGELQEMKDLILARCKSSFQGVSRKKLKCGNEMEAKKEIGVISQSIAAVLLREGEMFNVLK